VLELVVRSAAASPGVGEVWRCAVVSGRFRVGLRVADVEEAAGFYRGLGFAQVGSVPGPDDVPVMTILEREGVMLICDALVGMPFPDSQRERQIQAGPRGLGVAIGLGVDDLAETYGYCQGAGCAITGEPQDEPWGDRVFEFIDPFGYLWEISQPIAQTTGGDPFEAVRQSWFGDAGSTETR
jgi:uncharacterized glyoxalase superfamily protein PhnB